MTNGVSYRGGKPISTPKTSIRTGVTFRGGKPITAVSPIAGVSVSKYRAVVPFMQASYVTAGMPGMTAKSIAMFTKAATMPSQLTHSERAFVRRHMPSMKPEYRKKFVAFERELTQAEMKGKLKKEKKKIAVKDIRRVKPSIPGISTGLLMGVTPETKVVAERIWKGLPEKVPKIVKGAVGVITEKIKPIVEPTVKRYEAYMGEQVAKVKAHPIVKPFMYATTREYIEATPEKQVITAIESAKGRSLTEKEKADIHKDVVEGEGAYGKYRKLFGLPAKPTPREVEVGKFRAEVLTGQLASAEERFMRQITEPVGLAVAGERAKAIQQQEKEVTEAYETVERTIRPEWRKPTGEIVVPVQLKPRVEAAAKLEPEKYLTPEGQYKEQYVVYAPAAKKYVEAYETYKEEQRELAALPLPSPARQFGRGVAETLVTIPIAPLFIGRVAAETVITPTAAPIKAKKFAGEYYTFAQKEPFRVGGQAVVMLATGRVGKALKTKAYEMPTRVRGVKPYIGEPSLIGKLFGKEYHPTPSARPFSEAQLKAGIFKTPEAYFHGTSLSFVEQIKKAGKIEVSPGAKITDIERAMFFSAPRQPYLTFAAPTKTVRVKVSEVKDIPEFETYIPERATAKTKVEIPYTEYVEAISKRIDKPSPELTSLMKARKVIKTEIQKETLPRKRIALEARKSHLEQRIQEQQIKDVGIVTKVYEKPGAFLEWQTTPKRPTTKLQKKIFELESLTERLEKGTQSERATAKKYRDIIEETRFKHRLEKTIPKYEAAKKAVRLKRKETLTQKEFERMSRLRKDIDVLSKKEIEKGKLVVPPKAIKGYKWKGREEWEYTAAPSTTLYPVETLRGRAYSMLGIEKGAYKIYDPMAQQFVEVLKVSTEKPKRPRKASIIDLSEAYKTITERKPKKLTAKEHGQIAKLRTDINKARKEAKFDEVTRLESRIRRIKYKPRDRRPKVRLMDREAVSRVEHPVKDIRTIERAYREFDREWGVRPITKRREYRKVSIERPREVIREGERPTERRERPRKPREIERVERLREVERVERPKRIEKPREIERIERYRKEIVTLEIKLPIEIFAVPRLIIEPERKKRPTLKKKPYAWRVKNPIPELQEMFAHEMHKRRFV